MTHFISRKFPPPLMWLPMLFCTLFASSGWCLCTCVVVEWQFIWVPKFWNRRRTNCLYYIGFVQNGCLFLQNAFTNPAISKISLLLHHKPRNKLISLFLWLSLYRFRLNSLWTEHHVNFTPHTNTTYMYVHKYMKADIKFSVRTQKYTHLDTLFTANKENKFVCSNYWFRISILANKSLTSNTLFYTPKVTRSLVQRHVL